MSYNKTGEAEISFGFDVKKAHLFHLLENKLEEVMVKDNKIVLTVNNFEIVTLMPEV